MKKFLATCAIVTAMGTAGVSFAEDVKITTYYPSPYGSYRLLQVLDPFNSADITQFTQNLTHPGMNITSDFVNGGYAPGIFWSTENNNPTKPKAGIWMQETNTGSRLIFGTSNNYALGITNTGMILDENGKVNFNSGPSQFVEIAGAADPVTPGKAFLTLRNTHGTANDQFGINFINDGYLGTARVNSLLDPGGAVSRLQFLTGGAVPTVAMTIDGVGNVGIGTVAPVEKLHIGGPGTGPANLRFTWDSSQYPTNINTFHSSISGESYMSFLIDTGPLTQAEVVRIKANGNVGIGTTAPATPLVLQSAASDATRFRIINTAGGRTWDIGAFGAASPSPGAFAIGDITAGAWRLAIDPLGNVNIGTGGGPGPSPYRLYVAGKAFSTGGWAASDIRLKKNIRRLNGVLNKIDKINGVMFNWRDDEFPKMGLSKEGQIGIIAQELEKEFPELVLTDSQGYKAVAYDRLNAVLVEAVKELKSQNDAFALKNEELEGRIHALEEKINSKINQ